MSDCAVKTQPHPPGISILTSSLPRLPSRSPFLRTDVGAVGTLVGTATNGAGEGEGGSEEHVKQLEQQVMLLEEQAKQAKLLANQLRQRQTEAS